MAVLLFLTLAILLSSALEDVKVSVKELACPTQNIPILVARAHLKVVIVRDC